MIERQPEPVHHVAANEATQVGMSQARFDAEIQLLVGLERQAAITAYIDERGFGLSDEQLSDLEQSAYIAKRTPELALRKVIRRERRSAWLGRVGLQRNS